MGGQIISLNRTTNITRHATRHGGIGTVGGLKLIVKQYFFIADSRMDKAICPVRVNGGLLCVEECEKRDIVPLEREAYEILRIGLDEAFGDGIVFSHLGALGLRVGVFCNIQP